MRPSWEETFATVAAVWARRSTCPRLSVGCVVVRDRQVLVSGYNGAPRGVAHCSDVGCTMDGERCVRAVHAEQNAVAQAARVGVSLVGSTAYVTSRPCRRCVNLMAQSGVASVVFPLERADSAGASSAAQTLDTFSALILEAGMTWRMG